MKMKMKYLSRLSQINDSMIFILHILLLIEHQRCILLVLMLRVTHETLKEMFEDITNEYRDTTLTIE